MIPRNFEVQPAASSQLPHLITDGSDTAPVPLPMLLQMQGEVAVPAALRQGPQQEPRLRRIPMDRARLAARLQQRQQPARQGEAHLQRAFHQHAREAAAPAIIRTAAPTPRFVPASDDQWTRATAERIDGLINRNRAQMASAETELGALQQLLTLLQIDQRDLRARTHELQIGIQSLATTGREGFDADILAQINRDLETLERRIAAISTQAAADFQNGMEEIHGHLAINEALDRHIEEQAAHSHAMQSAQIAAIAQQLIELEASNQELHESLPHIQNGIGAFENQVQGAADLIAWIGSSEYFQQELALLSELIGQQPDPALERLLSFYGQMREQFAANTTRIEGLSLQDALASMQEQLVEISMNDLAMQFAQLEDACQVLQLQIAALPQAIGGVQSAQLQLNAQIKSVKKLLKEQKKAMRDKFMKCLALTASAVMTGGATAWIDLALTASGVDEKINRITQKVMNPLSKPIMKALAPVMAPINKILAPVTKNMAPIMQFVGYLNAVQDAASIINQGGTWEQAGMSILNNVAPKAGSPSQFVANLCQHPLDVMMQEVMKSAAPALGAIQNITTILHSADTLVNSLSSVAAAVPLPDAASMGAFVGDSARTQPAGAAGQQTLEAQRPEACDKAESAQPVNQPVKRQTPSQRQNGGQIRSHLKPDAKIKDERKSAIARPAVQMTKPKNTDSPPQIVEKHPIERLKATIPPKPVKVVATQPSKGLDVSLQAPGKITASPKNEMSVYRTAQANLNPLMPFGKPTVQAKPKVQARHPSKAEVPDALDCSWKGHFREGMGRIGEDEMAKMSPEQFKKDILKGTIELASNILRNKGSMQDPEDLAGAGKIFSFTLGWKEHSDKCKASSQLENTLP